MDAYERNQAALFERLLKPHMVRLYRFAYRLTGSQPHAEDLYQDVLTKVFDRLDDLAAIEDPGPWLRRVLYNQFIDKQRQYARRRLVDVAEGDLPEQSIQALAGRSDTAAEAENLADIAALEAALERLSDEHRIVLLLHDVEGYKLEEIQELIDVPIGTVKSRLHRARDRLRGFLQESGTFSRAPAC